MSRLKDQLCAALRARLAGKRVIAPEAGWPLLDAFQALSVARSYGSAGPNPISWAELAAWSQVMRRPIEPAHAEIIMDLDQVWLEHASRGGKAPEGVKALAPVSKHPISAALLDAVMG
ncbi:phage tail assembly chaperone [Paracoccus versutus]|uniref:Uncharacterized protein n=1 Tax=Paracoccus versutus TaxID=34007 RepID=A0A3D9XH03_PARVE|nr:hypothetical protein [Paracoccus versutus]REF67402.1 hypothetical protein BDD41_4427 [Paracoccus versutus]WGR58639.1 hypothetical protein E3U25_22300 [Paracoccus versutus]